MYLSHCARSEKVCSDHSFVQVDLFKNHPPLFLLGCQLFDLFDVNVFVGHNALVDLPKVASTQPVSESQISHSPLFTDASADWIQDIEICDAEKWARTCAKKIPNALHCSIDVDVGKENDAVYNAFLLLLTANIQHRKAIRLHSCGMCWNLTASLESPCQLGCKAIVVARSDPNTVTVGRKKAGDAPASVVLAFCIELLTEYRPLARTSVQAASHDVCNVRRLCLCMRRTECTCAQNGLPVQLGSPPRLHVS